ncbi:myb-like protein Q [Culex quinquefasciatus]|uniref:myb-like protein Q n=1 Tax=Culex quinquefasciatus TaxID=7176 RepID=UPI0018E377CA|nr:myb-like protein Q [Culex quinquefasciatus]
MRLPIMSVRKMRRRSRMKVLKILQSFSQGTFIAFVLMMLCCGQNFAEPGYLDFDNLPETNFTCAGKVIGGYYADLEASCQMFHVCTIGQGDEPMDIKFLCLNGTVFDQETRVCERVDEVDCSKSERFYYLNLELYGNTIIPAPEESSSEEVSGSASSPSPSTTSTTTTTAVSSSSTTTTKKPTTTTPSRRFIFNNSKGSPIVSSTTLATPTHSYSSTTLKTPEEEDEYEYDDEDYEEKDGPAGGSPALPAIEEDGSFSPQQFTLQQQTQNSQPKPDDPAKTGTKPAVSFQQQHFQNGGTLAVTNSHVTVTTHTTSSNGNTNANANANNQQKKIAQQLPSQKEKLAFEHQKQQQQQALLQQQMITKQHIELQKKQQEAAVQQQQKAIQQQQKQVQQHDAEIKNHQALLLLHQQKINRQQQKTQTTAKPQPPTHYNPYDTINQQQQQPQTHAPKRIPLLSAANQPTLVQTSQQQQQQQQQRPAPPSASQLAPFRLRAQGFKLPSQQQQRPDSSLEQEDRFEGYRRQPPPQVSLHLPFEQLRQQKDISLQFDSDIEDLSQFPQHKELKRSDPPFHSSIHPSPAPAQSATVTAANSSPTPSTAVAPPEESAGYADDAVEYEYEDYSSEAASGEPASSGGQQQQHPSLSDSVKSNTNSEIVVTKKRSGEGQIGDGQQIGAGQQQQQAQQPSGHTSIGSNSSKGKTNTSRFIINNEHHKSPTSSYSSGGSSSSSRGQSGHVYDNRPKPRASSYQPQPQAPKVIVTTSTSIRDNNGRTINYSINSSSSSSNSNSSPVTTSSPRRGYDEYKEDDVLSDPFFLDVPKVGGGRRRRSASTQQRKRRRRVIYIVPRFM